jgi:hypothetical protein
MAQEHEPIEAIDSELLEKTRSPSPTNITPKPIKPGTLATKPRQFRGKSIYDEQFVSPTLKRTKSQIVANLEAEKAQQLALLKEEKIRKYQEASIQLKDTPNLANILTEGDELSSSSSESDTSENNTDTDTASTRTGAKDRGKSFSNRIDSINKPVKFLPSKKSISRADSLESSSSGAGKSKRLSKFRRALASEPGTPLESVTESSSIQPFPNELEPQSLGGKVPHTPGTKKRVSVTAKPKKTKPSSPIVQSSQLTNNSTELRDSGAEAAPSSHLNSFSSHEVLTSGKILDESMSEVNSTLLDSDSNIISLSHDESIEHVGTPLVSQLTDPSFLQTDSTDLSVRAPALVTKQQEDRGLSFLFPVAAKERFVYNAHQKPTKRQEIRARVQEQNRQWALESQRMLEKLVSRMSPEIGVHVRRGLRGKRRRGNEMMKGR